MPYKPKGVRSILTFRRIIASSYLTRPKISFRIPIKNKDNLKDYSPITFSRSISINIILSLKFSIIKYLRPIEGALEKGVVLKVLIYLPYLDFFLLSLNIEFLLVKDYTYSSNSTIFKLIIRSYTLGSYFKYLVRKLFLITISLYIAKAYIRVFRGYKRARGNIYYSFLFYLIRYYFILSLYSLTS
ncbi:hypothetical protein LZ32DRAFT_622000 [Colletotrichum eremochloae]|nr:hypothetical protein LZ32DRAFT_622000 [Colletotrichum eremochloae]